MLLMRLESGGLLSLPDSGKIDWFADSEEPADEPMRDREKDKEKEKEKEKEFEDKRHPASALLNLDAVQRKVDSVAANIPQYPQFPRGGGPDTQPIDEIVEKADHLWRSGDSENAFLLARQVVIALKPHVTGRHKGAPLTVQYKSSKKQMLAYALDLPGDYRYLSLSLSLSLSLVCI